VATGYIMLDAPNRATPQGTLPRRGGFRPSGTCIVHTSEGSWQAGVDSLTRLVQTRADYGCYHRACDWADIALYYPWEWETWQDSETNNWAVGIAAACKTSDWLAMPGEIREGYYRNMARMAADFVVYMREQFGVVVPLRRLSGAEARARVPGFCAHGDSGVARSDPGRDFDWGLFFEYTRQALGGGVMPQGSITIEEDDMAEITPENLRQIYEAVWFGAPGAPLIPNEAGGNGEWPYTTLGSLTARIARDVIGPQLASLREAIGGLPSISAEAVADAVLEAVGADLAGAVAEELGRRIGNG
jgi:hypothetical protein